MSLLNGGLVRARTVQSDDDFIDEFCRRISDEEFGIVRQLAAMGRPVVHFTELVVVVGEIRTAPVFPLPPAHPLNPASRYAKPTVSVAV